MLSFLPAMLQIQYCSRLINIYSFHLYKQANMQAENSLGLSAKSKGILYRLKQSLSAQKMTLESLVCSIFEYRKQSLKPKELQKIIRKFDENLALSDIDHLFDELDENKNGIIFYSILQNTLTTISDEDNPAKQLNRTSLIKAKNKQQTKRYDSLIELKDALVKNGNYRSLIESFTTQEQGYLTKENLDQLLSTLGFSKKSKKQRIIAALFDQQVKLSIHEILQKTQLKDDGYRMNVSEKQKGKSSTIKNQSQFIKALRKQQKKKEASIIKSKRNSVCKSTVKTENYSVVSLKDIPQILAQYFNSQSGMEESFAALAQNCLKNNIVFFDTQNPGYSRAIGFAHIAEIYPQYKLFEKANSVIHRNRKGLGQLLEPKDIIQGGSVGNCYLLSALAAVVEDYPQFVYKLFVLEKNPSHLFGVRLFIDGMWKTFALDGTLPIDGFGRLCGAQPHNNQIWVLLLEKAWAKQFGSYDKIYGGTNQEGLATLTGAPSVIFSSKDQGMLKQIEVEFNKGSIVTCTTSIDVIQLTKNQQIQLGVFSGHAYTILGVYSNLPYKKGQVTLVKMRNPWGKKGWKKDWSFSSQKWTQQLRQIVYFTRDPKDGTFFISYDDFVIYFDNITISKVKPSYVHSWVTNQGNRFEYYENRVKVDQPGDYFFTVYQENPRKIIGGATLNQKSKTYLFIAKIQKQAPNGFIKKIKTVACKGSAFHDNTIETTLEPGNYLVVSSVTWNFYENHPYNLTVYGPRQVIITDAILSSPQTIRNIIESRSQSIIDEQGCPTLFYDDYKICKNLYCSPFQGIGFIAFRNKDKVGLEITVKLKNCIGVQFIKPYCLPLKVTVQPFEKLICPFLVNAQGYYYQFQEKYHPVPA